MTAEQLLNAVAARINRIESREQRRETLTLARVFAGLRYDKDMVYRILKESDMLEESVVYQDIFQKGEQKGLQKGERRGFQKGLKQGEKQGVQQGERRVALRQLERRFGKLPPGVRGQIAELALTQLEELCEALLDFQTRRDMLAWFKQQAAKG
jgi:predicted transposase YdaD